MKKYFVAGIVTLLPVTLTAAIVIFIVNFFTNPFVGLVKELFSSYGIFQSGLLFFSPEQTQLYISKLIILMALFFSTVLLGMLARWMVIHYFLKLSDAIFHKIPIVRSIYKTSQDVIQTIFGNSSKSFKQVVLVPFPNPHTKSLGLVTKEAVDWTLNKEKQQQVAVFVPTTPNPTSGFLVLFEPDAITYLDMSIEDALKYIISCGVLSSPLNPTVPYHTSEKQHD